MSVSDPIADMLTRVRNAQMAKHAQVIMPASKIRAGVARIMKEEGYIADFEVIEQKPQSVLRLQLRYSGGRKNKALITGIKRVSRPGRRIYSGSQALPWVRSGLGISIVSTSKGLMTGRQAKQQGLGGEVMAFIW